MKSITLIYDESQTELVENEVMPLFSNNIKIKVAFKNIKNFSFTDKDFLVCFLSDVQLRNFLEEIIDSHLKIALLPHPEMKEASLGFGVSDNLEAEVEHILETEKTFELDLLFANDQPVLNSLLVGNTFSLMFGLDVKNDSRIKRITKKLKLLYKSLKDVRLQPMNLTWVTENGEMTEKEFPTAVLGMVVVQHGQSALMSRRILEDSQTNDGLMHCLILAPRSLWEILKFGFFSFFSKKSHQKLPDYVALLKTDKICIKSSQRIHFTLDGLVMSASSLELEVKPQAINLVPGKFLEIKKKQNVQKRFKIQKLPTGELRQELLQRNLPFTNHASTDEFKWLFTTLRENSKTMPSYLVLMALSTIIATFGLFSNSSPVIIGAMILAPLMSPIISLSMGVLRQDNQLIQDSFKTIGQGMAVGYIFAIIITWLTPLNTMNGEILARIRPNLLDLGIAAASGVAGAYAHAKKEVAKTLAGVAIAVALVPPLAVSGIGFGWGDWSVFWGALLLLGTNLAGMVLAGALTFLLLGFSPFRLARKGLVISLIFVVVISAPLAFGFSKMVKENKIIQNLSGQAIPQGTLRDVQVIQFNPLKLSTTIVSNNPLDLQELEEVKKEIESLVGESVDLELSVAIKL